MEFDKVTLFNSYFFNISEHVIYISNQKTSLFLQQTTFIYCSSTNPGSAVSFDGSNSSIQYSCGAFCKSGPLDDLGGALFRISLSSNEKQSNILNSVSSMCCPNDYNSNSTIALRYGEINCRFLVISKILRTFHHVLYFTNPIL